MTVSVLQYRMKDVQWHLGNRKKIDKPECPTDITNLWRDNKEEGSCKLDCNEPSKIVDVRNFNT